LRFCLSDLIKIKDVPARTRTASLLKLHNSTPTLHTSGCAGPCLTIFPLMIVRSTLLSRFGRSSGLVTLRQKFVRRCQNCVAGGAAIARRTAENVPPEASFQSR
jgi:hypothetical protein